MISMDDSPNNQIVEAIDEVLAWSNLFEHNMSIEQFLQNLQVRCTTDKLVEVVELTSHLSIEDNMVFSGKYKIYGTKS